MSLTKKMLLIACIVLPQTLVMAKEISGAGDLDQGKLRCIFNHNVAGQMPEYIPIEFNLTALNYVNNLKSSVEITQVLVGTAEEKIIATLEISKCGQVLCQADGALSITIAAEKSPVGLNAYTYFPVAEKQFDIQVVNSGYLMTNKKVPATITYECLRF